MVMQEYLIEIWQFTKVAIGIAVIVGIIWMFVTVRRQNREIAKLKYYAFELVKRNNSQE